MPKLFREKNQYNCTPFFSNNNNLYPTLVINKYNVMNNYDTGIY